MRLVPTMFVVCGLLISGFGLLDSCEAQQVEKSVEKSKERKIRVVPYVEPPRAEPPGAKAAAGDELSAAAFSRGCASGKCRSAAKRVKSAMKRIVHR